MCLYLGCAVALCLSGPCPSVTGALQKYSRAQRKYGFSPKGVRHSYIFMAFHAPLFPRETNLKFRQALMVTHHELTSPKKMASFQGKGTEMALHVPLYTSFLLG